MRALVGTRSTSLVLGRTVRGALVLRRLFAGLATATILGSLLAVAPVAPVARTASAVGPTTWYVALAQSGTESGTSCDDATAGIQAGVELATTGDTIHLCEATWTLTAPVTIAGKALTFEATAGTATVVDGGGVSQLFSSDADLVFRNLTLRGGSADRGGAIFTTGSVTVGDSILTHNDATAGDGGAILAGGDVTITGSEVTANTATGNGGAITAGGSVTITGSAIAENGAAGDGGAIWAPGLVTLTNTDVSSNTAAGSGGAIDASAGVVATLATFSDNVAGLSGGAIAAASLSSSVTVLRVVFDRNVSLTAGGAIDANGTVEVSSGSFDANEATGGSGGAIWAFGSVSVTDGQFTANRADGDGGAIWSAADVRSDPSGYADNTSGGSGGAIYSGGSLTTIGDTFERNTAGAGGAIWADGDVAVSDGSFVANSATSGDGGAIRAGGAVAVTDGSFEENTAGTVDCTESVHGCTGGAILAGGDGATTTVAVEGSRFVGNLANGDFGGAIDANCAASVDATIVDSDFTANTVAPVDEAGTPFGGAVCGTAVSITGGRFTGNVVAGSGGAAYAYGGDLSVDGAVFTANEADAGGALGADGVLADVTSSTFVSNLATELGGALFTGSGTLLTVSASTFTANAADGADATGGAIVSGGVTTIVASTFAHNSADSNGSAIAAFDALHLANSTLVENTAGTGAVAGEGAIYLVDGDLELLQVTFVGNAGLVGHGAILQDPDTSTGHTVTLANSIFGSALDGCSIAAQTAYDFGGNLAVTDGTDSGCIEPGQVLSRQLADPADLALGELADNGGPTETVAISDGSAAVEYGRGTVDGLIAGTLLCESGTGAVDQRGYDRPMPLTSTVCDSGAFENQAGQPAAPTTTTTQVSRSTGTMIDPFFDTATVVGERLADGGGTVDPSGDVEFYLCYDATSAANCDWATDSSTFTLYQTVPLDGGTLDDGIGTASTTPMTASDGTYVFHAIFISDDEATYTGSEDDGVNETVTIAPIKVTLVYTGPVIVYEATGATSAKVGLSAQVTPNARCPIAFSVSDGSGNPVASATAWTGGNGTVTTSPITLSEGSYFVTVSTTGPCDGLPDFTGVLSVVPSTLPPGKGGTGGGWYQVTLNPPKVSYGFAVQVTSTTTKVGKVAVTTTTTRGQLLWVANNGWRLKGTIAYSSTDGSTAWGNKSCPSTMGTSAKCASFSGTGILQEYTLGTWVRYGTVSFVVSVSDGGTASVCKGTGKTKSCSTSDLIDYFSITMTLGTRVLSTADRIPVNTSGTSPTYTVLPAWPVKQGSIKVF